MMCLGRALALACAGLTLALAPPARARDLTVLSATALQTVLADLAPSFEQATGDRLDIIFDSSNLLRDRVRGGEPFDVALLTPELVQVLIGEGKIVAGSSTVVARTGLGIAVRRGAPRPDVATVAAFRQALLGATGIAYSTTGQSGAAFLTLVERLGIAAEVRARARTVTSGAAAEVVARGDAEIAVQSIPELIAVQGADFIGPWPAEIQSTVVFAAGIGTGATDAARAQAFIGFLTSPRAQIVIRARGLEPG